MGGISSGKITNSWLYPMIAVKEVNHVNFVICLSAYLSVCLYSKSVKRIKYTWSANEFYQTIQFVAIDFIIILNNLAQEIWYITLERQYCIPNISKLFHGSTTSIVPLIAHSLVQSCYNAIKFHLFRIYTINTQHLAHVGELWDLFCGYR